MGHQHLSIDLSPEHVIAEDRLLVRDIRSADPVPLGDISHFWAVVEAYRENDIARTGTDLRWARDHKWVAKELRLLDARLLREIASPPPGTSIVGAPSGPGVGVASVPEPGTFLMLAMGCLLAILASWARGGKA